MGVIDTFTKRQKRLRGEANDVFTYDQIPDALRVQICHIWFECLGAGRIDYIGQNPAYYRLHKSLAAEFGMLHFPGALTNHNPAALFMDFFISQADTDQALDMIDLSFQYAVLHNSDREWKSKFDVTIASEQAISDLNIRFLEHGLGYEFIGGEVPQLIKKNNEHLHREAIIPALQLLHEEGFQGANEEYRKAHEHYRDGRNKECLNECLKAFESTMKTICKKRKWTYREADTASALIDVCLKNNLFPTSLQSHLGTVKSALESAIPTLRNKMGAHGQGEVPKDVPQFYAEYLLHETAATIVFLVSAYRALK